MVELDGLILRCLRRVTLQGLVNGSLSCGELQRVVGAVVVEGDGRRHRRSGERRRGVMQGRRIRRRLLLLLLGRNDLRDVGLGER